MATVGVAMCVCAANVKAQTVVKEKDFLTKLHGLELTLPLDGELGPKFLPPTTFLSCYNPNLSTNNLVFEINSFGRMAGTSLFIKKTSLDDARSTPCFSINWDSNSNLVFTASNQRIGTGNPPISDLIKQRRYPAIFELSKATFNCEVVVNGKLSCKDELEVAEVKADQIKTKDINVEMNNAADYVFDENYNLRSLNEVESFVKENKHLPGVPSAAEMAENGMSMSQMSNLLLEKVEELTLHLIDMKKEINSLKEENASLRSKLECK
ncbi:MAG: hypothetical protein J6T67_08270 [Paludibacteraceae bacterium]|nr:hypothetical protein [Paludibacteraceae bacterium]